MKTKAGKHRCSWVPHDDVLYQKYHDEVWGVPEHDDTRLFEKLTLDGAQAGLSWRTILYKTENYKKAFDNFDIEKVAKYDECKVAELMQNEGIVRNKLKIESAIKNARAILQIQEDFGSFDKYLWGFVDGKTIINNPVNIHEIPSESNVSRIISRDMKKRGMSFVGPTIIYAFMQAIGMVNDHEIDCWRRQELLALDSR